jgi:hypothetical protein
VVVAPVIRTGIRMPWLALAYPSIARATCRMLLMHCTAAADRLALLSAGISIAISSAMIPITTSSSTSVKPRRWVRGAIA